MGSEAASQARVLMLVSVIKYLLYSLWALGPMFLVNNYNQ